MLATCAHNGKHVLSRVHGDHRLPRLAARGVRPAEVRENRHPSRTLSLESLDVIRKYLLEALSTVLYKLYGSYSTRERPRERFPMDVRMGYLFCHVINQITRVLHSWVLWPVA